MDHIDPVGADLVSTASNGRIQVFTDDPDSSRMVIDDFYADLPTLNTAAFAYELSNGVQIGHPNGWRISVWATAADAASSTNDFVGNTIATAFVSFGSPDWAITGLSGTGTDSTAFRIDFSNLSLNIGTGVRYIGIAPEQSSTTVPNWVICAHNNPAVLGNATPFDSIGINPSGSLGKGTQFSVGTNAAYEVGLVPEPATCILFGGSAALVWNRRRRESRARPGTEVSFVVPPECQS